MLELINKVIGKIRRTLKLRTRALITFERARYALLPTRKKHPFVIVSSERNAGEWILKCMDSVYNQKYDPELIRHIVIDDDSTDNTQRLIEQWIADHPGNRVELISTPERKWACYNNIYGFRMAPPGSIVLELNGDDWLPDKRTLSFLNKVYADQEVWMTYNTLSYYRKGEIPKRAEVAPLPRKVIENNSFRDYKWTTSALHSFRAELLFNVPQESQIDPETGDYWYTVCDKALYLTMLELAGEHSKHIYRTTYVYNLHENSLHKKELDTKAPLNKRIRQGKKHKPLEKLEMPKEENQDKMLTPIIKQ